MQWPKSLTDPSYAPMVLGAVAEGRFEHTFVPLTIEVGGHKGIFRVSQDALKIDGVRIDVSAILQQHIADLLGAYLLTPKLFDQMWAQRAVTVLPCLQFINKTSAGMIAHSACVDQQLARVGGIPPGGIAQTVGKTWVLENVLASHPNVAVNMGWHIEKQLSGVPFDPAPSLPGAHLIQFPGTRHEPSHIDYSQIALFVKSECMVDDRPTTFAAVAQSRELAALVSHEGVLKVLRQPGAPELVNPPANPPSGAGTVALTAIGAGIGVAVAGPPGALVGGGVGWLVDAVRRKLVAV